MLQQFLASSSDIYGWWPSPMRWVELTFARDAVAKDARFVLILSVVHHDTEVDVGTVVVIGRESVLLKVGRIEAPH